MSGSRDLALLGGCALLLLGLAGVATHALMGWQHDQVVWVMLASALIYAVAARRVWRATPRWEGPTARRGLILILATGAVARILLLTAPPLSTDIYRYVWDGRVQAAGINPYRYRPADPQLAFLRDAAVYPRINRAATALTIYPPVAQFIFFGVTRIANSVTGMKVAMVGFETLTVALLLGLLRRRNLPAERILLYVWNPLPMFEFAGSGHLDAAAIALMVLACWAADRRRPLTAGAVLAAAALVKFFPAVIAPALYRRWGWRLPAAFAGVVILGYLPYLGVGRQVLGFLPGYVQDEGLVNGSGFFLLSAWGAVAALPAWASTAYVLVAGAALATLAWTTVMRRLPAEVSLRGALLLLTAFTLAVSPHLPWYFTWVIPFLCFRPSWAVLYLTAAAPLLYDIIWSPGSVPLHAALYLPFVIILALEWGFGLRSPRELSDDGSLGSRHAG